jgi:hypothetical protein
VAHSCPRKKRHGAVAPPNTPHEMGASSPIMADSRGRQAEQTAMRVSAGRPREAAMRIVELLA